MKKQDKSEHYQKIIDSMEELTSKMDSIAQEYFEANVDFISKLGDARLRNELSEDGRLSYYDRRFKDLLEDLENENRLLKREKVNLQFRRSLLTADESTSLI
ncbi:hypothetical protein JMN32_08935 [Fulvivirga sp. 29W222]|uniref:Uncharacterized protein n=1 Tax=Fulvivirga marina TaxID=2494733 RepID=A0A937KB51_9BACT|nr:hypothetical protein [Fulvivirga marina]MBL6446431.1 hypothetical protein [Fulvivirga marina]